VASRHGSRSFTARWPRCSCSRARRRAGSSRSSSNRSPRAPRAPVHTHRNEDEHSVILEGAIGVELDGESVEARAGGVVAKPRGVRHAVWNPTDDPARFLEVIVPGGFESYFAELAGIMGRAQPPDMHALAALAERYDMVMELESIPRLAAEHKLDLGGRA
jgi:mannose-6-phosphate isomerase-like protein (cupin superfamily)